MPDDSLPKDAAPGCTLSGPINLAKCGPGKSDGAAPTKGKLIYTVPAPATRKEAETAAAEKEGEGGDEEQVPAAEALKEARRDADVRPSASVHALRCVADIARVVADAWLQHRRVYCGISMCRW